MPFPFISKDKRRISTAMKELLNIDEIFMLEALREARRSWDLGEVPVGAVIVKDGMIVARGCNLMITSHDPSAHAEMVVIREAARLTGNYRVYGATLYVTLEPCVMCTGAIILSRVDRVVYGAQDLKTGAHESAFHLLAEPLHNHVPEVTGGVLRKECGDILTNFFKMRRMEKKARKMREREERESALAAASESGGITDEGAQS